MALALESAGADGLCVATVDEALELRDGGVRAPIVVLYPVPPSFVVDAAARRIAVTAGSGALLDALVDAVVARGVSARSPLDVHVEVETGLGRGGILPVDVRDALDRLRGVPAIRVAGIWSQDQPNQ